MKLSHYPDLERCKKLTELGFPETEKAFVSTGSNWNSRILRPSVMEMLDAMPNAIFIGDEWFVRSVFPSNVWYFDFRSHPRKEVCCFRWLTANSMADMVIWLVQNGHLSFQK